MPSAMHPQAKFDPIPPDLDLESLVEKTANFNWVVRIPASKINRFGPQGFEKLVLLHVIHGGKPLVIEGWNDRLDPSLFSARWLESAYDKKEEPVRDIGGQTDMRMTIGHYLRSMPQLTNQWTSSNFREERRQRLYLKDIDCPPEWHGRLRKILPPNVFYMNDNIDRRGNEVDIDSFGETGCAPAGDLMSSLPEEMRAQNLMCYIGHEGTYTPAHREMCGSLGQNIMIEASGGDNGEKPGSSIWFMTETKDREVVKEYFLSMLGHDIEIEKHFAQINAWKKASFPVYIVEQKPGDFLLIPPLAPHQVWNRGTRTMKVAWNRTTVETLELAIHEALPKARLVCRDEQYKNKAIIYYTLKKYYQDIQSMDDNADIGMLGYGHDLVKNSARSKQMMQDFKKLFGLYTDILVDEMFGTKENKVEYIEFDSNITCSYCRCNIFNRFLTCKQCIRMLTNGDEDTYDICMECYAMGRSCVCVSNLTWCEQWNWSELVQDYERWRTMIIQDDGYIDIKNSPLPLEIMRKKAGQKSVAQICQEQLRRRPFNDITKVEQPEPLEPSDVEIDGEGRPVKKKNRRKKKAGETYRCHVCCHRDNTFRLAFCSNLDCAEAYCFGTLYRAFDLMPQDVLRTENWKCPKCLGICNCGSCRKAHSTTPYTPKKTLLGHDTKRVADDRSKELLVDFRVHNLTWLKATGEESRSHNSKRMQRLKEQADAEKAKAGNAKDVDVSMSGTGDHAAEEQLGTVPIGYGDQSGILETATDNYGQSDMLQMGASGDPLDAHGEPDDMFVTNASAEAQAYPDHLGDRDRMVGLGYYEQEGPDRILFDDFEVPDLDALEQEEENEFLQKMLQKAKRKAKKDDDEDGDFRGPKSWRKKSKADNLATTLYNAMVDPSLLSGDDTQDVAAGDVSAFNGAEIGPKGTNAAIPGEPNQPILRHAKPLVSYVEPDEGLEEFNEVYEAAPKRDFPSQVDITGDQTTSMDPLDLAAEAMQMLIGGGDADVLMDDSPVPPAVSTASRTDAPRPRGRRGRPKRQSERVALANAVPEPTEPKQRKSRTSLLASQGLDRAVDDKTEARLDDQLDKHNMQQDPAPGPRKRGRPPKVCPAKVAVSPSPSLETPKYISMAERMALRGKKLRVAKSRQAVNRASTASSQIGSSTSNAHVSTSSPVKFAGAARSAKVGSVGWHKRTREDYEEQDQDSASSGDGERQQKEQDGGKGNNSNDCVPAAEEDPPSQRNTTTSVLSRSVSVVAPRPGPPGSQAHFSQLASVAAPKAVAGPTVVRLGDSDLDQDDNLDDLLGSLDDSVSLSDSGSDDDDEGIPAVVMSKPVAKRGRGRPRGGRAIRGGRGRGRGWR